MFFNMSAAALAGCFAAYAVVEFAQVMAAASERKRVSKVKKRRSPLVRLLVVFGKRVQLRLPVGSSTQRLVAAGRPLGLSDQDLVTVKLGAGVVLLLALLPFSLSLPGRVPYLVIVLLPVIGYLLPDLLLARAVKRRAVQMESQLPDLLDLMRVAIDAGMSLRRALAEVGARHNGLLASEFRRASRQLELGSTLQEALDSLRQRCPAPTITTLVTTVLRTVEFGAPLAGYLKVQAQEARANRARMIAQQAAKAAPKIQLVVAVVMVPSILLLVAAAMVANFMQ